MTKIVQALTWTPGRLKTTTTTQETERESDVFGVEMTHSNDKEIYNQVYISLNPMKLPAVDLL